MMRSRPIFVLGCLLVASGLLMLLNWQPLVALGVVVAIPVVALGIYRPNLFLYAALAAVALGQLGRIPPLHGGAPLLSDGLLAVFFLTWLITSIWKRWPLPAQPAHLAWYGFLVVALAALIFNPFHLGRGDFMTAGLYWVRLCLYSSLIWIIPVLFHQPKELQVGYKVIMGAGLAVLALGILQIVFVPNIGFLSAYGWDPHVGRFVSTFLDPNYLGGYLAILLTLFFALNWEKPRLWVWLAAAVTVVAGILTYSRSGYLALAIVLIIIGLRYSWKLLLLAVVCITPLALTVPRIAQRVEGGFAIDQTAQDRVDSWERALVIIKKYPLVGIGYNTYDVAQKELNLTSPIGTSLASAGSDSSLLNVAATTGVVGFTLFVLAGLLFMVDALKILRRKTKDDRRVAAYVVLVATPALLVNAMFVNALFYPLILIVYAFFIGALYVGEPESSVGQ